MVDRAKTPLPVEHTSLLHLLKKSRTFENKAMTVHSSMERTVTLPRGNDAVLLSLHIVIRIAGRSKKHSFVKIIPVQVTCSCHYHHCIAAIEATASGWCIVLSSLFALVCETHASRFQPVASNSIDWLLTFRSIRAYPRAGSTCKSDRRHVNGSWQKMGRCNRPTSISANWNRVMQEL